MKHQSKIKLFLWSLIVINIFCVLLFDRYYKDAFNDLNSGIIKLYFLICIIFLSSLTAIQHIGDSIFQTLINFLRNIFWYIFLALIFTFVPIIFCFYPDSIIAWYLIFLLTEFLFIYVFARFFLPIIYINQEFTNLNQFMIGFFDDFSLTKKLLFIIIFLAIPYIIIYLIS